MKSPTGKWLPLDLKAQVYRITEPADGGEPTAVVVPERYVSHFATCREANQFSGSKKKDPAQEVPDAGPKMEG